jgi:hypothetical protein
MLGASAATREGAAREARVSMTASSANVSSLFFLSWILQMNRYWKDKKI